MKLSTDSINKVNLVLDMLVPLAGRVGIGIKGILALYRTFRKEAPAADPYPELTLGELAELLRQRSTTLLDNIQADRDAATADTDIS